jgi:hypothetical protein
MKNNIKALELIELGLSSKTVSKLTESQIDKLHTKMVIEQTAGKGVTTVSSKNPNAASIAKNLNTQGINVSMTETDGEMEEGKKKKTKKTEPNPWAICHSQVGPKKTRKFERCVMAVKKSLKEGKNPVSLFLESEIMRIVEKHIPPRITKGDLLTYLTETETAPAKPKTSPTTKPGKPAPKPRPGHPGKNPNPGENPAPKAISPEIAKKEVINTIMKLLKK